MMKKTITSLMLLMAVITVSAQLAWPTPSPESKAGLRWWWPGSAVDDANIEWTMQQYASVGAGSVEITPIYGVQGNEAHAIPFLSPQWMSALQKVEAEGKKDGILVDMNTGTGWPFGGPEVPIEEAACKVVFIVDTVVVERPTDKAVTVDISIGDEKERRFAQLKSVQAFPIDVKGYKGRCIDMMGAVENGKLEMLRLPGKWLIIAQYESRTRQQVKRAAPGGAGYVIDHFDRDAVRHYLDRFDRAFSGSATPWPHNFFNDSYEVYNANWTPTLLKEFKERRGYDLDKHYPELLGIDIPSNDREKDVLSDYRETLSDMLLENFSQQWTEWAHSHGALTRNQAHGSPASLIDVYASVDVPEIEGFGLSEFNIRGLSKDSGFTRPNFSDVSMLKYASSAAHITGKPLVSSETFTWLTEHFRTSLSQMKPDLDLMFTCGVNHMFFHGTCYSPKEAAWPGWRFYASIDMSPNNSIWRDAPELMKYIERSQSFLQMGKPDNDFLVLVPLRDMWAKRHAKGTAGLLMAFDIHKMDEKAPEFIRSILEIDSLGYDCDYISERILMGTTCRDGKLVTAAGTRYSGLLIPGTGKMPEALKAHLDNLKAQGAHIIYGIDEAEMNRAATPEVMRARHGLRAIRRSNDTGHHYFIANLTPDDKAAWMPLTVPFRDAAWFDPLTGEISAAMVRGNQVYVSLLSGQSRILQTFDTPLAVKPEKTLGDPLMVPESTDVIDLTAMPWQLSFVEEAPKVGETFQLDSLRTWEGLSNTAAVTMGTGVYTTTLKLDKKQALKQWMIDLGDVRESARVYVNDDYVGCVWCVPYLLDLGSRLHKGINEIRIEVTNLPANRIADLERRGVKWRIMEEINVVDLNYNKTTYEHCAPVPSGLNSSVRLHAYPSSSSIR
ncbi:MAG: glycosyl hydrolase family 2 [Prevotella sp.]|nr:glycosyl hydrolase family 2 [Prevotella sp.]